VPVELTMPKLSDSTADAVIVRWLKSPGDHVARGDELIEVETDKATVVYEAESEGTLETILRPEGATVAVGEPIATLAHGSGEPERESPARRGEPSGRPNATPVARAAAVELGVSLHGLTGSGPGGRITREDVRRAAATATPAPAQAPAAAARGETRLVELTATQATIARRMAESATTIPVFTVSADVDMSLVTALRRATEERDDVPSVNDFVVKAVGLVLRELPRFNASFVDGTVELHSRVNVGIAVAAADALLVPVVADADTRTLAEIAGETRRLAEAARRRALGPADLTGGTFTVSNLGMFGVRSFTAIVDPPQVAILAVGGVRREPVEGPAGVGFRDKMTVTLTCDHRVVYGADGARFLVRLRELLERPLMLTL
jgi:pyruvate dehydrogenase E2 component (dihydrolipoamide acetyltransferase)